ncbi:MAG: SRPBCC family protein [Anaerolineae bacterium]
MSFSACPIAVVNAPVDQVWSLLSDPAGYALWWDAQTRSIAPKGPAQAGQKIDAQSKGLGKQWDVRITVESVDESKHQIDLTTRLPLNITVHNHIVCVPVDGATCRVTFG